MPFPVQNCLTYPVVLPSPNLLIMKLPIILSILAFGIIPVLSLPANISPAESPGLELPRCYYDCRDGMCMDGCSCDEKWNICVPVKPRYVPMLAYCIW